MIEILQSVLAFVVVIGLLITFHEFGHYWVARRFDVRVLRFSVGFGRPLWRKTVGPDRTEFVIAAVPLGGYVKMLDSTERPLSSGGRLSPEAPRLSSEAPRLSIEELPRAFDQKPLAQRAAIVLAGPLFNFIFAAAAYWLVFMLGISGLKPTLGDIAADTPAAAAGMRAGDQILAVDGTPTPTWSAVVDRLIGAVIDGGAVELELRAANGGSRPATLDLGRVSIDEMAAGDLLGRLGMSPRRPPMPAVIGEVAASSAAAAAGLRPGDEILALRFLRDAADATGDAADAPWDAAGAERDDAYWTEIKDWEAFVAMIQAAPERPLQAEVRRGDEVLLLRLVPAARGGSATAAGESAAAAGEGEDGGPATGYLGVSRARFEAPPEFLATESYPPVAALIKGVDKTAEMSLLTLRVLGKMLSGEASVKNLSGPVSIAHYAGRTAQMGLVAFLMFLAMVSVSLGVLNLLPVPMLDGGHLLYYLVEAVTGRPLSERAQAFGQQLGLAALLGLMTVAFYNDILRLLE